MTYVGFPTLYAVNWYLRTQTSSVIPGSLVRIVQSYLPYESMVSTVQQFVTYIGRVQIERSSAQDMNAVAVASARMNIIAKRLNDANKRVLGEFHCLM